MEEIPIIAFYHIGIASFIISILYFFLTKERILCISENKITLDVQGKRAVELSSDNLKYFIIYKRYKSSYSVNNQNIKRYVILFSAVDKNKKQTFLYSKNYKTSNNPHFESISKYLKDYYPDIPIESNVFDVIGSLREIDNDLKNVNTLKKFKENPFTSKGRKELESKMWELEPFVAKRKGGELKIISKDRIFIYGSIYFIALVTGVWLNQFIGPIIFLILFIAATLAIMKIKFKFKFILLKNDEIQFHSKNKIKKTINRKDISSINRVEKDIICKNGILRQIYHVEIKYNELNKEKTTLISIEKKPEKNRYTCR